jgi:hypothetical protein
MAGDGSGAAVVGGGPVGAGPVGGATTGAGRDGGQQDAHENGHDRGRDVGLDDGIVPADATASGEGDPLGRSESARTVPDLRVRTELAITRLREAAERFVLLLRRDGFDPEVLDELCEAIDRCGRCWTRSDTVPKSAALILAELFPAIDACAWLYPEPTRQRIAEAAARVAQSVSACLDSPDGGLPEL